MPARLQRPSRQIRRCVPALDGLSDMSQACRPHFMWNPSKEVAESPSTKELISMEIASLTVLDRAAAVQAMELAVCMWDCRTVGATNSRRSSSASSDSDQGTTSSSVTPIPRRTLVVASMFSTRRVHILSANRSRGQSFMRPLLSSVALSLFVCAPHPAHADWFYSFVGIECDVQNDRLVVRYKGAYDEAGKALLNRSDRNQWEPDSLVEWNGDRLKKTRTVARCCKLPHPLRRAGR